MAFNPQTNNDFRAAGNDFRAAIGTYLSWEAAAMDYFTGSNPAADDFAVATRDLVGRLATFGADLAVIAIDVKSDPGFKSLAKYLPIVSGVLTLDSAWESWRKDVPKFVSEVRSGNIDFVTWISTLNDAAGFVSGLAQIGITLGAIPEEGGFAVLALALDTVFNNTKGIIDILRSMGFIKADGSIVVYTDSGAYSIDIASQKAGSVQVLGSNTPTTYSAGPPGFQGVPTINIVDNFTGNATFIGESGSDTFTMNGALIARGTTGSGGGMGNTYIIPATSGYMGSGTIEGQGAGNVVMLVTSAGMQQLTTLTIQQYEDSSSQDFATEVPIAEGVTNTGDNFLLIQDDPGTAPMYNMSDNPHNGEGTDFELYIDANAVFSHIHDGFGPTSESGQSYLAYQQALEQDATAHITFAGGAWSDYGIAVVDDTANPPGNGSELMSNSVPGDFLLGPGAGPALPDPTDESASDDESSDDSNITVSSGYTLTVSAGSAVSAVTVSAGGTVVGGGALLDASTDAGVVSAVTVGALASLQSGELTVTSGGSAVAVTVVEGALAVSAGGQASGVVLSGSGAGQTVSGVATGTIVRSGATNIVGFGGVASGSFISSGGAETVSNGGSAVGTMVSAGGVEVLSSGATATAVTIDSGGLLETGLVVTGAITASAVVGATISVGGVTVLSGGVIDYQGVTVSGGGGLTVLSGAMVSGVTVAAGGSISGAGEIIGSSLVAGSASGLALGGAAGASGYLEVQSGGHASGVTVTSGTVKVDSGGTVSGEQVPLAGRVGMQRPVRPRMRLGRGLRLGGLGRLLAARRGDTGVVRALGRHAQLRLKLRHQRRKPRVLGDKTLDPRHQRGDQGVFVQRIRGPIRHTQVDPHRRRPRQIRPTHRVNLPQPTASTHGVSN
jgi:autotransporter passenger strand-loop-strand repeat protein